MKSRILIFTMMIMGWFVLNAQTTMNIHQSNGTVLQIPLNTIDSITYAIPNPITSNPGAGVTFDGYTYSTIVLGNGQEWMAENLRTTKYSDGTDIPLVTDSTQWANNYNNSTTLPMMCWYNNDQITYTANKFGALYNWYAVNISTNGNKNVCPAGWHVPTNLEWNGLTDYLGGALVAGGKMKSTGTQYWQTPNIGATNEIEFSGLPSGYRVPFGSFGGVGSSAYLWSSSDSNTSDAPIRYMDKNDGELDWGTNNKELGASIRCLKD